MWLIDRIVGINARSADDAGAVIWRWALTFTFFVAALAGYAAADVTPLSGAQEGVWLSPLFGAVAILGLWIVARGGFFPAISRRTVRVPRAMHLSMLPSDIGRVEGIDVLSYAAASNALERTGFGWRGDYMVPEVGRAIFRLFVNPELRAYAELVAVRDFRRRAGDEFCEPSADSEDTASYSHGLQPAHPVILSFFVDGTALITTGFPFDPSQRMVQRDAWVIENFRLLGDDPARLRDAHLARRREMVREGKQLCTHVSERAYREAMTGIYWRVTHAALTDRATADVIYAS